MNKNNGSGPEDLSWSRKEFGIKQIMLLTATATKQVIDDMCRKLNVSRENITITEFYRENLFLTRLTGWTGLKRHCIVN